MANTFFFFLCTQIRAGHNNICSIWESCTIKLFNAAEHFSKPLTRFVPHRRQRSVTAAWFRRGSLKVARLNRSELQERSAVPDQLWFSQIYYNLTWTRWRRSGFHISRETQIRCLTRTPAPSRRLTVKLTKICSARATVPKVYVHGKMLRTWAYKYVS